MFTVTRSFYNSFLQHVITMVTFIFRLIYHQVHDAYCFFCNILLHVLLCVYYSDFNIIHVNRRKICPHSGQCSTTDKKYNVVEFVCFAVISLTRNFFFFLRCRSVLNVGDHYRELNLIYSDREEFRRYFIEPGPKLQDLVR